MEKAFVPFFAKKGGFFPEVRTQFGCNRTPNFEKPTFFHQRLAYGEALVKDKCLFRAFRVGKIVGAETRREDAFGGGRDGQNSRAPETAQEERALRGTLKRINAWLRHFVYAPAGLGSAGREPAKD